MIDYNSYFNTPRPEALGLEPTDRNIGLIRAVLSSINAYLYSDDGDVRRSLEAIDTHGVPHNLTVVDLDHIESHEELLALLGMSEPNGILSTEEWEARHSKLLILGMDTHLRRPQTGRFNDKVLWLLHHAAKTCAGMTIGFHSDADASWQMLRTPAAYDNYWLSELITNFGALEGIE